jgi:acyl carrier protein
VVDQGLAGLCAESRGLDQVGIHDDFFEIGGHSLLAARLVSRIKEMFQVELSLRAFFEERTTAKLAAFMLEDALTGSKVQRIAELVMDIANYSDNEVEAMLDKDYTSIDEDRRNEAYV